jgi:glycosyltransferase involved in cell wall biosynthesis
MKISIIIPVYNEEKTIIQILEKVNKQKSNLNLEIIISDDGSTDSTKELLEANKSLYDNVHFGVENCGKGSAIINVLNLVTGEYILIQDADLEYDPSDYEKLIKPIYDDNADIVYGSRFQGSEPKRILYFSHRLANFILTLLVNILTNINFSDVETGYKLIRTSLLKGIDLKEKSFAFEIETTMKLAKKNIKFYEVGINYYGRTYEEGKKIGLIDGLIALYKIFYYRIF